MFNKLAKNDTPKNYNILSIGQRGVGKTVFFVGNYVSQKDRLSSSLGDIWFDCDDQDTQSTIEKVRQYVAKTREYPPATMRITNFDFCVKQKKDWGEQTLHQVCWWDPPGESCQIYNPAFLTMATNCDACCLFLDANDLVQHVNDVEAIAQRLAPIRNLIEIFHHNGLKSPLALILTKCDLLDDSIAKWQTLKQILHPLIGRLSELKITYQPFYSRVTLVEEQQTPTLRGSHQEKPLLWLLNQLQKDEKPELLPATPQKSQSILQSSRSYDGEMRSPSFKTISLACSNKAFLLTLMAVTSIVGIISTVAINQAVNSEPDAPPTELNSI